MRFNASTKITCGAMICLCGFVFLFYSCVRGKKRQLLKDYLAELQPGMTLSQTTSSIPSVYFYSQESITNVFWLTALVPKDARVVSRVTYVRDPPDWAPLGSIEYGYLYFDSNNCLVGLRYSSSRYSFEPSRLRQWQK